MSEQKQSLIAAGHDYETFQRQFQAVVKAMREQVSDVPALHFSETSDDQIDFVLLGKPYRFRYVCEKAPNGKWMGQIISERKNLRESEEYEWLSLLWLDKLGNVGEEFNRLPWSANDDSGALFFHLIHWKN